MESLAAEWEEFGSSPGRSGRSEIEVDTVNVVTFREGKIWRMRGFRDSREALEAVGLSE